MIIVLKPGLTDGEEMGITQIALKAGFERVTPVRGDINTVLNCIGKLSLYKKNSLKSRLENLPEVEGVMVVDSPMRLSSRKYHPDNLAVRVNGSGEVGGKKIVVIAGPCSVESEAQILCTAESVKNDGADILRGGAFKPRTSPYDFQGLGEEGLKLLAKARKITGLPFATEVMSPEKVDLVAEYADILQVGARNMQNFDLLKELGKINKPVILKRGLAATIDEFLGAAEYILAGGNNRVILCLRGVGGKLFAGGGLSRNLIDIGDIPLIKNRSHLPLLFDPSHACGRIDMIEPMSLAALCAGADGLMVEVHRDPDNALCDGLQSLNHGQFATLMNKVRAIAPIVGRE
ncbi:MAG: 3-deoxy-7-phosphoheptulonate synthase [bacterium]|nr:3-deoxy-7-phosphoheptulonate synthase [bacterium]